MLQEKKNQSSIEYLVIVGLAFSLIAVLGGLFLKTSVESKEVLDVEAINKNMNALMDVVEKIYLQGYGERITLIQTYSDNIENITIVHINGADMGSGPVFFDYINVSYFTGRGPEGKAYVTYQPSENYIRINCTLCTYEATADPDIYVSYYNESLFAGGNKRIRVSSDNNGEVLIDFVRT